MQKLFSFSQKHPIMVIIILLIGCVLAGLNVDKLFIDSGTESMMMRNDPNRVFYEETLEKFGSDSMMMIYAEDSDLFSVEKLTVLEQLVSDLSNETLFPGILRIESLYSVSNIKGYPDYLDNNPLLDYPPETEEAALQIKELAIQNQVLVDNLVSKTGNATVINLYLASNAAGSDATISTRTVRAVRELLHNEESGYDQDFNSLFEIGRPYMSEELTDIILEDMATILPIAFAVLLIMLVITMGSLNGAVLPFLTSSLSIFFTFGFMGAAHLPFNLLTFIIPILVIVVGSTEDVHILSEYMVGLEHTGNRKSAVKYMAKVVGTAIFLTSLTTFLGFMSISINKIIVLIQFGLIAGFTMLINPITTCLVAPMYLKYFGAKQVKTKKKRVGFVTSFINSVTKKVLYLTENHKKPVIVVLLGFALVIGSFTYFIEVDNDTVGYFKKGSEFNRRLNVMHEEMAGAQTFFIRFKRRTLDDFIEVPESSASTSITNTVSANNDSDLQLDIFAEEDTGMDLFADADMDIFAEDSTDTDMDIFAADSGDLDIFAEDSGDLDLFADNLQSLSMNPIVDERDSNKNLFQNPEYLRMIDDVQAILNEGYDFDNSISIADYIKLINREMNVGQPGDFDMTPDPENPNSRNLIAQYALTLHHEEVSSYITSDWSEANILVRHNISSSSEIQAAIARAEEEINEIVQKVDPLLEFKITGENILINKAADSITTSQIVGLSLLLFIILIIMSILFMNIKAGLLSLIPNLFPIVIFFGVMGIFKIPLNLGTCMVAAISIGISVDDTIHFMTRFNKEMRFHQNRTEAVKQVITSEIRPIISTSLALILGFSILAFAQLMPLIYFGVLSAIVMFFAMIADLLITPILLSSFQLTNLAELNAINIASELKDSPIFQDMSLLEIKRFTLLGKVQECSKGDHLITTGDKGNQMFIILKGSATVEREDAKTGDHLFISKAEMGSLLGEISLLRNVTRTATVVANEDMSYLEIDWHGLLRLQHSAKKISMKLYKNIAAILGQRLVEMTDKVQKLQG